MTTHDFKEPSIGDVLAGRYRLESVLGRGGFGVVYRAMHLETRRAVAVKVLLATHARADKKAVERFKREAILSASLEYPNTVDVFDYGETDDGVFFLVMDFIRGAPLSEVIAKEAPMHPHRVVHIVRQVLYSLMEAHAKDIVHRDVKPENIMIVPLMYDANYVKVMDFGIAKMVSGGPQLTQAGQTYGTPRYMAAEQLRGGIATPQTDLYAVGLIIYEMLVGQPAVTSENLASTISRVINGPPVELDPDMEVPLEFHDLVKKASAPQPEDRFATAEHLLEALSAWTGPSSEVLAVMGPDDGDNFIERQREQARLDAPTQALGLSKARQLLDGIEAEGSGEGGQQTEGQNEAEAETSETPADGQPEAVEAAALESEGLGADVTCLIDSPVEDGRVTSVVDQAAASEVAGGGVGLDLKVGCLVVAVLVISLQAIVVLVLLWLVVEP